MLEFGEKLKGQNYRDRLGAYGIIINNKKEIGLVKTPGGYFLPGGGLEDGETHVECIKRELIEEIGFGVEVEEFVGCAALYGFAPGAGEYLKVIGYFYMASFDGTIYKKKEIDHEFIWVNLLDAVKKIKLENQAWAIIKALENLKI